jgi:hypothetical protein
MEPETPLSLAIELRRSKFLLGLASLAKLYDMIVQ